MRTLLVVVLAVSSSALAAPKVTAKTTDLYPSKACKEKVKGTGGEDPVLTCPSAVKGYTVTVSFSAVLTSVTVSGDGKDTSFTGLVGKKLEWRLVGGKPVALLAELADADDANPGKRVNPRVIVMLPGGDKPASEQPIEKDAAMAWKKARAAADALATAK